MTVFKLPFTAISEAVYTALSDEHCDVGLSWFDSSVPIEEIYTNFKNQAEFAYGIFGASSADCAIPAKNTVVWDADIQLEVYSNYKGRKVVAEKLEAVMNYFSDDNETGYNALQRVLNDKGYALVEIIAEDININLPMYGDYGVWQSGGIRLKFRIHQL
jgi:hypothetical protein